MKKSPIKVALVLISMLIMGSCQEKNLPSFLRFKNKKAQEGEVLRPVARVYDNYLYEQDLEGIVDRQASAADSASIV
ncbi:MAG: hypothetical protein ACOCW4_03120, partial [bacterium]